MNLSKPPPRKNPLCFPQIHPNSYAKPLSASNIAGMIDECGNG